MDHARDISDGKIADAPEELGAEDVRAVSGTAGPSTDIAAQSDDDLFDYLEKSIAEKPKNGTETAKKLVLTRVSGWSQRYDEWKLGVEERLAAIDLAPDLAANIGSPRWLRGFCTMVVLAAVALAFWPSMTPLEARPAMTIDDAARDELRSQMIMPLALGADSGRRMSPTAAVIPLQSAPERPQIELVATLASGDSFQSMLRRAGLSSGDISRVSALVSGAMPLEEIESGTTMDIVLGRREASGQPRPLDELAFRARFDLELAITRESGQLALERNVIRVDETPLRIRGQVGESLYRSMRAAGAPASAVQDYIKAIDNQVDMDREVRSNDEFDMIVAYRRAATGERQAGKLLYAGVDRGGKPKTQLMRWGEEGRFYEASGVGEQRGGLVAPVPGRISSRFGMRRHPILGYRRMHSGLDFRARHGTPIVAVTDGTVTGAGRMGGCGIAVRLKHGGNLSTRYCHMSRMSVRRGQTVRRGQVIGYVGSTGLSTGPHLHYEMYRGGRAINPASVKFVTRAQLSGSELAEFRSALSRLKTVEPGAALEDLVPLNEEVEAPKREIEKLDTVQEVN
ncbi:MAG: peptidoglycan DD-metalloendopeptidase family protein [Pseudomonadota bacterium]